MDFGCFGGLILKINKLKENTLIYRILVPNIKCNQIRPDGVFTRAVYTTKDKDKEKLLFGFREQQN